MTHGGGGRIAILYPGDYAERGKATAENNRFADLFRAFAAEGISAEAAVYRDDFCAEVRDQLMQVDGVLVWINPIQDGRNRSVLDAMLREVANAEIFVSAHPDIILKLGTKNVLYRTRDIGWGCDTHRYESLAQMRRELPARLADGNARVLKQARGNGGIGVWKVQSGAEDAANGAPLQPESIIRVRHAQRGCSEERITLREFFRRCEEYFLDGGRMIDQEYQERLPEGMIRCYLVHEKVAGFGHQAVNALFPAPAGAPPTDAPQPGPRFYHPPTKPEFQHLKDKLERAWVPAVRQLLAIDPESLPILWDCDFLLGPKDERGEDSYVLCEINVSSVAPYPDSAVPYMVDAAAARIEATRRRRSFKP